MALLDANARMRSDGGGKVTAALRPLLGAERIVMLFWAVARRGLGLQARIGTVNGKPAILRFSGTRLHTAAHGSTRQHSAMLVVIDGERIVKVLTLMNPDKLPRLACTNAALGD